MTSYRTWNGTAYHTPAVGSYDLAHVQVTRGPQASFTLMDADGAIGDAFPHGQDVDIEQDPGGGFAVVFPGIVSWRRRRKATDGKSVEVRLLHRGYQALRGSTCYPYVYESGGGSINDRDSVIVNSWNWFVFGDPEGTLDADGASQPLDGVPHDVAVKALLGKMLVYQHDFQDNSHIEPSGTDSLDAEGDVMDVYALEEERPSFQRIKNRTHVGASTEWLRSIPIHTGAPTASPMGNLAAGADVILIGEYDGSNDPVVQFSADDGVTWTAASLTRQLAYLGSSLDAWTATVTPGGTGNRLRWRMRTPGTAGDATTTKVHYLRAFAPLATADTGLGEGTIDTYTDPHGVTGAALYVADDFVGMNRAAGLERIRTSTIGDFSATGSPHWDLWVDDALDLYFQARRGTDLNGGGDPVFSVDNENLRGLDVDQDATDVAWLVRGQFGGKGAAGVIVDDQTAYTAGGLYVAANDPNSGAAYGDMAHELLYEDRSVTSAAEGKRRARAYLQDRLEPRETYSAQFYGTDAIVFGVGDRIQVEEADWSQNGLIRVDAATVGWDAASGETVDAHLGQNVGDAADAMRDRASAVGRGLSRATAASVKAGFTSPAHFFDSDHYARHTLIIPENVEVDRVLLDMTTVPFLGTTRGVSVSGLAAGAGGASVLRDASLDTDLDLDQIDADADGDLDLDSTAINDKLLQAGTETAESAGSKGFRETGYSSNINGVGTGFSTVNITGSARNMDGSEGLEMVAALQRTDSGGTADAEVQFYLKLSQTSGGSIQHFLVDWRTVGQMLQNSVDENRIKLSYDTITSLNYTFSPGTYNWLRGVRLSVKSIDGGADDYFLDLIITEVLQHVHDRGTLRSDDNNVTNGDIDGQLNPTGDLQQNSLDGLLVGDLDIGYNENSGGVDDGRGILYTQGSDDYYGEHVHVISGSVQNEFGVLQYAGEDPVGTGLDPLTNPPLFAEALEWAVEPSVDAQGIPNDWANDKHPMAWGVRGSSTRRLVDVTRLLPTLANGRVRPGPVHVYFKGTPHTDGGGGVAKNPRGIGAVHVSEVPKYREPQG